MKKLLLLLNDYPASGKSTLARCLSHYLQSFGAEHQLKVLVEETDADAEEHLMDASRLTPRSFLKVLENSPITILEAATGQADFLGRFYTNHGLHASLEQADISLSVVLPVTGEMESFDTVIEAVDVYSDRAEYLIVHWSPRSQEDEEKVWDCSYAARVMDMFDAAELHMPKIGFELEHELQARRTDLIEVLQDKTLQSLMSVDFIKWHKRVFGQVDSARHYLFGEAFLPTVKPKILEGKAMHPLMPHVMGASRTKNLPFGQPDWA